MAHAFGKVILSGEHSVVYGGPALACGLERGAVATAFPDAAPALVLGEQSVDSHSPTWQAFQALAGSLGTSLCRVEVQLDMPAGVGLGASAALGVAIARSLGAEDDDTVLAAANAWEGVFHGNPSGVDAACACAGGCIRFIKDVGFERVPLGLGFELAIAVAGPPSSTKEMVESVARFQQRDPTQFEQTLEAMTALVNNVEHCLREGDLPNLGTLLDYNQMLLSGWFLSTPEIEECCRLARRAGAHGAKLTGAGGGGCVIALPGADGADPILQAWRAAGYRCFVSPIAADPEC